MPKRPTGSKPENEETLSDSVANSPVQAMQTIFGENLRIARVKVGLLQRDIEARTGIKQAYISQIEAGKLNPTLTTMVTLAVVVGKDLSALLLPPPSRKPN